MNTYSEDNMYESYSSEIERMQKCIDELQQENKILKENAENNDKVVDKVNWENQLLKKENQQLKNDINKLQKELNEENLQCSKYSIAFNNLKEKNEQLKDNWNKLKKFLEEWKENEEYCYLASSPIDRCRKDIYGEILDKMQELKQGSDSNE